VLTGASLQVQDGRCFGLLGPNGSGKSTLIKCVARILDKASGTVTIDGQPIAGLPQRHLARLVAYVPQNDQSPFPQRVFDVALLGRTPYTSFKPTATDRRKVAEVLQRLNLQDLAFENYSQLSGGQRQRVLLARALAQEPRVLLMDEPTTFLDLRHQLEALLVVRELVVERDMAALLAVHDLNLATRFTDQVAVLRDGHVTAEGEPANVLNEDLIRDVYGVDTIVGHPGGYRTIVPVAPRRERDPQPSPPDRSGEAPAPADTDSQPPDVEGTRPLGRRRSP
jgi:iron complex transport system ATP-binding protein